MNLLVFYPYIPWPLDRGTYQRTFHLLKALAVDHEVDLLALAENGDGMEYKGVFEEFCRKVEFIPFQHPAWPRLFPSRLFNSLPSNISHWTLPGVTEKLAEYLAPSSSTGRRKYDVVYACDIVLAQYLLKEFRKEPLVVDRSRVDLQFQLMEHAHMRFPLKARLLRWENYLKLWFYERKIARRAAMEIVCGPDDLTFIRRYISRKAKVKVLVNGVDLGFFRPDAVPDNRAFRPTVLFCGAMDYNPNIDALRWYFGHIHDQLLQLVPTLEVLIVGKAPVPEIRAYAERPGIAVAGGVPDVRPYYRQAWLQIVPLRIGGGTRLKIVESMAIGTPVVSTSIGAQGLDLTHERDAMLADTPEEFARVTARMLNDHTLRHSIEAAGIETARNRFSWTKIGKELSDAINSVRTANGFS